MILLRIIYICFILLCYHSLLASDEFYIGVAGPMTGKGSHSGQEMLEGIQMFVDEINDAGGICDKKVKLIIKDDKNDPKTALSIANAFVMDHRILIIIGHYFSTTSIMAGKVYQKYQIPAISGSATAKEVTDKNDWYFRTVPNNAFQANYIANYINSYLKINRAVIVYDTDEYGIGLSKFFKNAAQSSGIEVIQKFGLNTKINTNQINKQIVELCNNIKKIDDPGCVFIATHVTEALQLIYYLQNDRSYPFLGSDSFGSYSFINQLFEYNKEIHFTIPYLSDIADRASLPFIKKYKKKYKKNPNWVSASYYDASHIAINAIQKANLSDDEPIRRKRKKIQKGLNEYYNIKNGLKGVTGTLFFNSNGDVEKTMKMGVYKNNQIMPSFVQYHLIPPESINYETLKKTLTGDMVLIKDQVMQKTMVVYTRIDAVEVINFDINKKIFKVKFNLSFTYNEDFDVENIQFQNAINPITIAKPVQTKKKESLITKQYRLEGTFRANIDFKMYPFETHKLIINFYHKRLSRDFLIYTAEHKNTDKEPLNNLVNWKIIDYSMYQDVLEKDFLQRLTQKSQQLMYSRFNAMIQIKRHNNIEKYTFLFLIIVLNFFLIIIYLVKRRPIKEIVAVLCFFAIGFIHLFMNKISTAHLMYLEYVLFVLYLLLLISWIRIKWFYLKKT